MYTELTMHTDGGAWCTQRMVSLCSPQQKVFEQTHCRRTISLCTQTVSTLLQKMRRMLHITSRIYITSATGKLVEWDVWQGRSFLPTAWGDVILNRYSYVVHVLRRD